MLSSIKLSNFKCFQSLELNCAPLTLLSGLNGMGKSSVIQALLILRQSFLSGDLTDGKLVLGGELADLGTGVDVLFEDSESDSVGFELHSDKIRTPWALAFDYSKATDQLSVSSAHPNRTTPLVPAAWSEVPPFVSLIYIDAERIGPRKFYPLSETRGRRGDFGSGSEYALNYLNLHQDERLPDGSIEETSETIDNLTRSVHALSICERRHAILFRCLSPLALWERREEVFQNLIFGPDVKIDPEFFGPTVKKLIALDESAAKWRKVGGSVLPWTCTVTPETVNLMKNRKLREARRFKSQGGTRELFPWHAKFSNGRRIHLRFNADSRKIEIGYIGPHLPI